MNIEFTYQKLEVLTRTLQARLIELKGENNEWAELYTPESRVKLDDDIATLENILKQMDNSLKI